MRPEGRDAGRIPSSFRDPAGFLFVRDGTLFRHVAHAGAAGYDLLLASGPYEQLTGEGLLVRHDEVPAPGGHEEAYGVLRPTELPLVTCPGGPSAGSRTRRSSRLACCAARWRGVHGSRTRAPSTFRSRTDGRS